MSNFQAESSFATRPYSANQVDPQLMRKSTPMQEFGGIRSTADPMTTLVELNKASCYALLYSSLRERNKANDEEARNEEFMRLIARRVNRFCGLFVLIGHLAIYGGILLPLILTPRE